MISGFITSHQLLAVLPAIFSIVCCTTLAMILHELGHLAAARACKISASEIGLGVGPKLFGFRLGGVAFSLRAIPVASFLRMDGTALEARALPQQLLVHPGGTLFITTAATLT